MFKIEFKACIAEFLTTALLVFIGCFAAIAYQNAAFIAATFAATIVLLIYATAHISGQINPVVTMSLLFLERLHWHQAIANIIVQLIGAIVGAAMLYSVVPDADSKNFGTNLVHSGYSLLNAYFGEIIMTFVLVLTILETAITQNHSIAGTLAPFSIGFAVFVGHIVLIPITGCSLNPARSFGSAVISDEWNNFHVFVFGPVIGAIIATAIHWLLNYNGQEKRVLASNAHDSFRIRNDFISGYVQPHAVVDSVI
jgi:MIP family channel proteins